MSDDPSSWSHYWPSMNWWSWEYAYARTEMLSGPLRVDSSDPAPDEWKPRPLLGFTRRVDETEPLLWEGDQA